MIDNKEYQELVKQILIEKDEYKKEIDSYFSINESVIIQRKAKSFIKNINNIDPNLIINF